MDTKNRLFSRLLSWPLILLVLLLSFSIPYSLRLLGSRGEIQGESPPDPTNKSSSPAPQSPQAAQAKIPNPALNTQDTEQAPPVLRPQRPLTKVLFSQLETERGQPVFDLLFSDRLLSRAEPDSWLPVLQRRFQRKYPLKESEQAARAGGKITPYEEEVTTRVGILKALQKQRPLLRLAGPQQQAVRAYLVETLRNPQEHWLVRAQSLRNLRPWLVAAPHEVRQGIQRDIPMIIQQMASRSEREIAEALFEQ